MSSDEIISKTPHELGVDDLLSDQGEINSLQEAIEKLLPMNDRNYLCDQIPAWRSTYFRGEDQIYEIPLLPSLGRNAMNHLYPDGLAYEKRPLRNMRGIHAENEYSRHLNWYKEIRELEGISSSLSDMDLMMEARHFGLPTRLLDWTTDPLVSLWFACNGSRYIDDKNSNHFFENDAAIYVFHAYIFGINNQKVKADPYLIKQPNLGYCQDKGNVGSPFEIVSADANTMLNKEAKVAFIQYMLSRGLVLYKIYMKCTDPAWKS